MANTKDLTTKFHYGQWTVKLTIVSLNGYPINHIMSDNACDVTCTGTWIQVNGFTYPTRNCVAYDYPCALPQKLRHKINNRCIKLLKRAESW